MHTAKTMSEEKQLRINAIFQNYRESLPPMLAELTGLWEKLESQWDNDVAIEFDRKIHNLAGSAATFDLKQVGTAARELEHSFKPLLHAEYNSDNPRWAESSQLLAQLKVVVASSANK